MRPNLSGHALLLAILITATMPMPYAAAAEGAEEPLPVCGIVENGAGWRIGQVEVTLQGRTPSNAENSVTGTTDANGVFVTTATPTRPDDAYVVRARATDTTPDAIYAPSADNLAWVPEDHVGVCPDGAPGYVLGPIELAAPDQGFLELTILDLTTAKPLPGVSVTSGPLSNTTNTAGFTRIACFIGTSDTADARIVTDLAGYQRATRDVDCPDQTEVDTTVGIWRRAVPVVVTVSDATTLRPAGPLSIGPLDVPASGAAVDVDRLPSELTRLDVNTASCYATAAAPLLAPPAPPIGAPVSTSEASPYVCSGVANELGLVVLQLPWSTAAPFHVSATTEFGSGGVERAVANADNVIHLPISVVPVSLTYSATVMNIDGAKIPGADVTFTQQVDAPAIPQSYHKVTDANGNFTADLAAGTYTVTIDSTAYNQRSCELTIAVSGTATLDKAYCWTLITAEKAAVAGTIRDATRSVAITGANVCLGTECDLTDAAGAFAIEVPAGLAGSATVTATAWVTGAAAFGATDRDALTTLAPVSLARANACVSVLVRNATGVALPSTAVSVGTTSGTTGSDGRAQFALPWTHRTDLPTSVYNDSAYGTTARRTAVIPHYAQVIGPNAVVLPTTTCSADFDINIGAPSTSTTFTVHAKNGAGANVAAAITATAQGGAACGPTCAAISPATLTVQTGGTYDICAIAAGYLKACQLGYAPVAGGVVTLAMLPSSLPTPVAVSDAHTNAALPGATVTATGGGCTAPCSVTTPATLTLAVGEPTAHTYNICASKTNYVEKCATGAAGSSQSRVLLRRPVLVNVSVVDAHTEMPVRGAIVRAVGATGFTCAVAGATPAFDCETAATDATGAPPESQDLIVPYALPAEACLVVDANTYSLNRVQNNQIIELERVAFQAANYCPGFSAHSASGSPLQIRLLRAAAVPISGTVLRFDDKIVPGATVTPTGLRVAQPTAFVCDPAVGHGAVKFTDCDGDDVLPTGQFSLVLPQAGPINTQTQALGPRADHRFDLVAKAAGHHDATWKAAAIGDDDVELRLLPTSFEVSIRVRENSAGSVAETCSPGYVLIELATAPPSTTARGVPVGANCYANLTVATWTYVGGPQNANPLLKDNPTGMERIGKEFEAFRVTMRENDRVGAMVALLGPAMNTTDFTVVAIPDETDLLAMVDDATPDAELTGTLTDGSTIQPAALPGIALHATSMPTCDSPQPAAATVSGAGGEYELTLPCEGEYTIEVVSDPLRYEAKTIDVDVDAPTVTQDIVLARTATSVVNVIVIDQGNPSVPPAQARVALVGTDVNDGAPAQALDAGQPFASFEGLTWGTYSIVVTGREVLVASPVVVAAPGQTTVAVVVVAGDPSGMVTNLLPAATLSGAVVDGSTHDNAGVPGVVLLATTVPDDCDSPQPAAVAVSGPDGAYSMELPCAGEYEITVVTDPARYLATSATAVVGLATVQEIELTRTSTATAVVHIIDLSAETFLEPVAGVQLRLVGTDVENVTPLLVSTDLSGEVRWNNLIWGSYLVETTPPAGYTLVDTGTPFVLPPVGPPAGFGWHGLVVVQADPET